MSQLVSIVHKRLRNLSSREPVFDETIQLYRLRLKTPLVRKSMKPHHSFVSDCRETNLKAWNEVWKSSDWFEGKCQALYFYQSQTLNKAEFSTIVQWVADCTCWEHSDDLSKMIANVTEANPKWSLPILKKWVTSKNPWQRRQSLVGLIEYSRKRKTFLPFQKYIQNVDALLMDSDYYVQKAIGWTLREIYNIYPTECLKYRTEKLASISSIAYSAATEKLKPKEKAKLNQLRKQLRR